jgi:hypothetical protein
MMAVEFREVFDPNLGEPRILHDLHEPDHARHGESTERVDRGKERDPAADFAHAGGGLS